MKHYLISAAAALVAATAAAPASASTTLGALPPDSSTVSSSCDDFLVWQAAETGAGLTVPSGSWVITSASIQDVASGASGRSSKLKLLRPAPSRTSLDVVGDVTIPMGTTGAVATVSGLHVPTQGGDILGLAGTAGSGGPCYYQGAFSDYLHATGPGGDVPVGAHVTNTYPDSPTGYRVDLQATIEPDADADGFGDETQDACPGDPSLHEAPCVADVTLTGTVTPATVGVGGLAMISGTIDSAGPGSGQGVTLHVTPGSGLQIVSNLPNAGCTFTTDLACPVGLVSKGAAIPFVAVVKATSTGAKTLAASVTSSSTDPNAANNAVSGTIQVQQRVPLVCGVPSLKGLTKGQARKLLGAAHCKLGKVSKKKSKKGKKGTVIKQSPKAGSTLAAGAKVKVTVRK
jgi:PASTA domain/Domain of unknown function DUF11